MNKNQTYTRTSFNFCYPVNEVKAKKELDRLDEIIKDLKKEAEAKKQFFIL
ncbi:MAG: hypothetical protein Q8O75_01150 [bacterium]|nr:hypothetical protein [bacterium]